MIKRPAALLLLCFVTSLASAQERDVVVSGGWLFASTSNARVRNPGILIRAGEILQVGGDLSIAAADAERVQVADTETVVPGFFDLHAHYAMDLFGAGRKDETVAYPPLFIANGVTSTFPAGEMNPDDMRTLRIRINNGEVVGPRIMNSGPYFGSARPNWNPEITRDQIYAEIDQWAELGIKGIKTKGITPDELKAVIERAHFHGLTVTGHLDSGNRNSVNPRDAVIMGIDRIEHFMGGDAFVADKSAYASYQDMTFNTPAFKKIAALFIRHRAYFDATLSTYGMYGAKDTVLTNYFAGDERRFLTPYMRDIITKRPVRANNVQFEKIYYVKRKEIKAFFDAGGGDLMTLGTDHPSWGVWFTPFSAAREMYAYSASGIPNWQILKIATINSARAMGFGDRLGTIEAGKWADLVVLRGNPLQDIKHVRNPRVVIKAGRVYDPTALLKSAEGKIGPASAADTAVWAPTPRTRRGGAPAQ
jgi:imidazolonepropionase-like amidohydrolase